MKNVKWMWRIACILLCAVCLLGMLSCAGEDGPGGSSGGGGQEDDPNHEHTYDTARWTKDETHHWHASTCAHGDEVIDREKHTWDEGVNWIDPKCEEEGIIRYTCTVCGATKDGGSDPVGHDWGYYEVVVRPGCESEGVEVRTCRRCSDTESRPISPTNHAFGDWNTTETHHWHACQCGAHQESVEHTFEEGFCTVCGAREGEIEAEELAYTVSSDGTYYVVSGVGTLSEDLQQYLVIPESYRGLPVLEIAADAFKSNGHILTVGIPDTLRTVGAGAFFGCTNLYSITVGQGVESIGVAAFSGCPSLTALTVSPLNTRYSSTGNCLVEIASATLLTGCSTSQIPAGIKVIGEKAFFNCRNLTSVTLPTSLETLSDWAFFGCTGLQSVFLPANVTTVGAYAFSGCSSVTRMELPGGLVSIGERAFSDCTSLAQITIPGVVGSIGSAAFHGCTALTSIHIPDSVASIGNSPLTGCTSLVSITVGENNPNYYSESNCLIYQQGRLSTSAIVLLAGCKTSQIPKNVTIIEAGAFYGHTGLTSVVIPSGVQRIDAAAFAGCTGLTSVDLGTGVQTIGHYTFKDCVALTVVIIPESVTYMGIEVFSGCAAMETIHCARKIIPTTWEATWSRGCNATILHGSTGE